MSMYVLEVVRKPGEKFGKAIGQLLDPDGDVLARGPMVTGGKQVDSEAYGGVTPPGQWVPVETLERREHLRGDEFTFCRMLPNSGQRESHPNRTYGIHIKDPFMVHYGGSSSGCVCFLPSWWSKGLSVFNTAYRKGLFIEVIDDPDVDLSEFSDEFAKYDEKYA